MVSARKKTRSLTGKRLEKGDQRGPEEGTFLLQLEGQRGASNSNPEKNGLNMGTASARVLRQEKDWLL